MKTTRILSVFSLVILFHGIARCNEMTFIQSSLAESGISCIINNLGNVIAQLTISTGDEYPVVIDRDVFIKNGEKFRMIWGGVIRSAGANLTEEELEWILTQNATMKLGGIRILSGEDKLALLVRIPIPAKSDGKTIQSAMWMCANLLGLVDHKIKKDSFGDNPNSKNNESSHVSSGDSNVISQSALDAFIALAKLEFIGTSSKNAFETWLKVFDFDGDTESKYRRDYDEAKSSIANAAFKYALSEANGQYSDNDQLRLVRSGQLELYKFGVRRRRLALRFPNLFDSLPNPENKYRELLTIDDKLKKRAQELRERSW